MARTAKNARKVTKKTGFTQVLKDCSVPLSDHNNNSPGKRQVRKKNKNLLKGTDRASELIKRTSSLIVEVNTDHSDTEQMEESDNNVAGVSKATPKKRHRIVVVDDDPIPTPSKKSKRLVDRREAVELKPMENPEATFDIVEHDLQVSSSDTESMASVDGKEESDLEATEVYELPQPLNVIEKKKPDKNKPDVSKPFNVIHQKKNRHVEPSISQGILSPKKTPKLVLHSGPGASISHGKLELVTKKVTPKRKLYEEYHNPYRSSSDTELEESAPVKKKAKIISYCGNKYRQLSDSELSGNAVHGLPDLSVNVRDSRLTQHTASESPLRVTQHTASESPLTQQKNKKQIPRTPTNTVKTPSKRKDNRLDLQMGDASASEQSEYVNTPNGKNKQKRNKKQIPRTPTNTVKTPSKRKDNRLDLQTGDASASEQSEYVNTPNGKGKINIFNFWTFIFFI